PEGSRDLSGRRRRQTTRAGRSLGRLLGHEPSTGTGRTSLRRRDLGAHATNTLRACQRPRVALREANGGDNLRLVSASKRPRRREATRSAATPSETIRSAETPSAAARPLLPLNPRRALRAGPSAGSLSLLRLDPINSSHSNSGTRDRRPPSSGRLPRRNSRR